ncbi:hypothetical protein KAI12_04305 [Candidatus Bathyarchaeota archaeon]|nr:hypothetical protein [Candidatus Bathyarchaeota archaeon]
MAKDLGKLVGKKLHCASLAVDSLRKSIKSYKKRS